MKIVTNGWSGTGSVGHAKIEQNGSPDSDGADGGDYNIVKPLHSTRRVAGGGIENLNLLRLEQMEALSSPGGLSCDPGRQLGIVVNAR